MALFIFFLYLYMFLLGLFYYLLRLKTIYFIILLAWRHDVSRSVMT